VVLVAPGGCFAVVHAGWRGALAGISGKALSLLCEHVPCAPASVNAYLGPHIGGCCYEVSADLLARFRARFGDACDAGASHLSLSAAIESDLRSVGAAAERIVDSGLCTYEHDGFFSYRASAGTCGRHGAMVCRV
jgi:copper oxidase (laccase) domain-containing protein